MCKQVDTILSIIDGALSSDDVMNPDLRDDAGFKGDQPVQPDESHEVAAARVTRATVKH